MAKRTALLIANDAYEDEDLARLNAPWDDVVRLREALETVGEFDIMTPLHNQDIGDIQIAVSELFQTAGPDDTILLYYTGHGVRDRNNKLHFALKRTQVDRLPANTLSASFVRDAMKDSQAAAQVIILDCCHSGQFIREGAKRKSKAGPLQTSDLVDTDAGPVAAEGKYILTASEPDQSAYEAGGQSVFTRYLVDGLVNGTAAPAKENISIEDLHTYLYRTLRAEGVPQQPMKMFASSAPEMIIGRNPNPRPPIPDELSKGLFSADRRIARWAFEELKDIADGPDEERAEDARKLMQQRLDQKDDLLAAVADPIRAYLLPPPEPEPDDGAQVLDEQLLQMGSLLEEERHLRERERDDLVAEQAVLKRQLSQALSEKERAEKIARRAAAEEPSASATSSVPLPADMTSVTPATSNKRAIFGSVAAGAILAGVSVYLFMASESQRASEAMDARILSLEAKALGLADELAGRAERVAALEKELATSSAPAKVMTSSEVKDAQALLKQLGFYKGVADGQAGPLTMAAVNALLSSLGRPEVEVLRQDIMPILQTASAATKIQLPSSAQEAIGKVCDACPDMAFIKGGTFTMGSPSNEEERDPNEKQREVAVKDFAIARTEVTFDQWDACVAAGGCSYKPDDAGWGHGSRPVINVSWDDAQEYIAWLNTKVEGDPFRLPSEAEWEYAARAGTTGRFSNNGGEAELCDIANHADQSVDYSWKNSSCSDEFGKQTAPVASFQPNELGLYDIHGNVWEWVEDVYADYSKAPTDGSAHVPQPLPDGHSRVLRGGSWGSSPRSLRSADRYWGEPDVRFNNFGFRPARTLFTP